MTSPPLSGAGKVRYVRRSVGSCGSAAGITGATGGRAAGAADPGTGDGRAAVGRDSAPPAPPQILD
ncbi:hypothetical protein Ae706Ps2_2521 [Pseudonocardia sp. Ae706_Ps2]|nr:hypothetical protein Ae706Ps2_2521 [Pseudonocardia sp. Ae706_Ps2]